MKKHRVTLTTEEREALSQFLARGKADVRKLKHAQILLKADEAEGGPGWSDSRIAEAQDVGLATVERLRRRFIEEGFEAALSRYRGPNRVYQTKLDGDLQAHLIALACSQPPDGRSRCTLALLAERMVALGHVETLSYETVRQTRKKTRCARTRGRYGASRPSSRRSSSSTWRTCWRCTGALTTRPARWSAWTRPSSS